MAAKQNTARKEAPAPVKADKAPETEVITKDQVANLQETLGAEPTADKTEEVKPHLFKYEKGTAALGSHTAIPPNFKYANTKLRVGPVKPKKETTVMGRIYEMVAQNPDITGAELVRKMVARRDWAETGAKVKYAANGVVCSLWCVGYINGAVRPSAMHLKTAGEVTLAEANKDQKADDKAEAGKDKGVGAEQAA